MQLIASPRLGDLRSSQCRTHRQQRISLAVYANGKVGARSYGNPLGVHALVFSGGWSEIQARRAIAGAAEAGFDLIEVPLLEPETVDVMMTKQLLSEYNMAASASLGLRLDADVSSEDPAIVEEGKTLLFNALDAVAGFNGNFLCGVIYSAIHKYDCARSPTGYRNAVAAIKELAQRASDKGVTLGLEVINRYETNVLNTATQGMEMLTDIDEPNVTIHLDTYHMNIEENSMASAVQTCGDKLGYVHIGESHRGYLGTGSVDFEGLFNALAAQGYTGPLTFESFSSTVVSPTLSNSLCVWRNLWDDSDDLAQHSRAYMDVHWRAALQAQRN